MCFRTHSVDISPKPTQLNLLISGGKEGLPCEGGPDGGPTSSASHLIGVAPDSLFCNLFEPMDLGGFIWIHTDFKYVKFLKFVSLNIPSDLSLTFLGKG